MTRTEMATPRKTRDIHNHHMDSTLWDNFDFRGDDVVVATYAKSGTTWTQQIVGQLLHQGDPTVNIHDLSPWWDMRIIPPEARQAFDAQTHRRVVKTHLPADALVMSPKAKYLYIARDGRDVVWSLYNHHSNFKDVAYEMFNLTPGLVGEPLPRADPDIVQYFNTCLPRMAIRFGRCGRTSPLGGPLRHQPNVKLIHFNRAKGRPTRRDAAPSPTFFDIQVSEGGARHRRALHLRLHEGQRRALCAPRRFRLGRRRGHLHQQGHERPLARRPAAGRHRGLREAGRWVCWGRTAPGGWRR